MANNLEQFGFTFGRGGAHSSRTMMLDELTELFNYLESEKTTKDEYLSAIEEDNCLAKRSGKTRKLTYRHLCHLYTLNPEVTLFKALRYFWSRDEEGRAILALLCVYARDSIFRLSAPFIQSFSTGAVVSREALEEIINNDEPDRFSPATLKSTAQNINSTWTKSGHLSGKTKKIRRQVEPSPGAVAYALFLGYLTGSRGEMLFETEYVKLLDSSTNMLIEQAELASRRGWIVFKRVGNVIEVQFPNLLNGQEEEWVRE